VFAASGSQEEEAVRAKWVAFGLSALSGVDPSAGNQVGAAILHTTLQEIGVLARLEPNLHAQQFRLTVRSIKPEVALRLAELLIPNL
jgi:AP-2 complex subunit alpha